MVLLSACGAGSGASAGSARGGAYSAGARIVSVDPAGRVSSGGARLARAVAVAKRVYVNEVNGGRVHTDLRLVAADQVLLSDLGSGDLVAAQAEAQFKMMSNAIAHITRVSIIRGPRVLVNAVWNSNGSFVVAPLQQPLRVRGRTIGTLLVSVQDIVGYIKLIHKFTGAQAIVRGVSGQVRTSLPAAADVSLPSSGHVTIAARRYLVGSFQVSGWGNEALTVWVLEAA